MRRLHVGVGEAAALGRNTGFTESYVRATDVGTRDRAIVAPIGLDHTGRVFLRLDDPDAIGVEDGVSRHDRIPALKGLGDQQAIERISMMPGESTNGERRTQI